MCFFAIKDRGFEPKRRSVYITDHMSLNGTTTIIFKTLTFHCPHKTDKSKVTNIASQMACLKINLSHFTCSFSAKSTLCFSNHYI
jgi:hypothetical protein